MPLPIGHLLAGKYRIERPLGQGAMGEVLAARHVDLDELRAIKLMLPSQLGDTEGVERFLREARAAVKLKSPHVCKVLDVGRLEDGTPYIVMELLEGADLKAILDQRGPLPISEAALFAAQACEALGEAHALGIIHRDIKLANLFVTQGPNNAPWIKVLDFGIAKVGAGGQQATLELTKTSDVIGTPVYMSPEQMRVTKDVDARTDLWSLGVVLYAMLTGKLPFAGTTITQVCAAVIADPPRPLAAHRADVPPALEAAVLRCLEKDPNRRFASAAELSAAIAPFITVAHPARPPSFSSVQLPPSEPIATSTAALTSLSEGLTTKSAASVSTEPEPPTLQAPAKADSSSRLLLVVAGLSVVALGTGIFLLTRDISKASPPAHTASPVAAPSSSSLDQAAKISSTTPPPVQTIEPPPPSSSPSLTPPPPPAPPAPTASARAEKPASPKPSPPPAPRAPKPPPPKDAFGESR